MNGYGEKARGQIIEVWADNLEDEIARIRDVVENYQYIALDTEFPGIVARPTSNASDYNYRTVKYNVDLLKVIQLGITFADEKGCLADGTSTWQFNFRFDLNNDMYAQNSIDFLKENGIDFDKQQKKGVDVNDFGELIMNSGLLMNNDIKWIAFHGCYDFGYLLKLLTCDLLPDSEIEFFNLLQDFFPSLYDIKYLLLSVPVFANNQIFSLQKLSEHLKVTRIGSQHQAGSDSLVTCKTFFRLIETYFNNHIDEERYSGIIYGLGITSNGSSAMLRTNSGNTHKSSTPVPLNNILNIENNSTANNNTNSTQTVASSSSITSLCNASTQPAFNVPIVDSSVVNITNSSSTSVDILSNVFSNNKPLHWSDAVAKASSTLIDNSTITTNASNTTSMSFSNTTNNTLMFTALQESNTVLPIDTENTMLSSSRNAEGTHNENDALTNNFSRSWVKHATANTSSNTTSCSISMSTSSGPQVSGLPVHPIINQQAPSDMQA